MTESKHLKARIRARMARTGERYMTARRHVVGDATRPAPADDHGWRLRGGLHPDTAAIANVLAHHGAERVGGDGARRRRRPRRRLHPVGVRGARSSPRSCSASATSGSTRAAGRRRRSSGSACRSSCTRPAARGARRRSSTPRSPQAGRRSPRSTARRSATGTCPRTRRDTAATRSSCTARDGDRVRIDDRNLAPLTVAARAPRRRARPRRLLQAPARGARAGRRSARRRCARPSRAGLDDAVEHLGARSASFGLPAWRKWARMLDRHAQRQGVAAGVRRRPRAGRRAALDLRGRRAGRQRRRPPARPLRRLPRRGGGAARGAARWPRRRGAYRELAERWHELAELALPATCRSSRRCASELAAVHESVVARGDAGAEEAAGRPRGCGRCARELDAEPPGRDGPTFAPAERAGGGDLRGRGRGRRRCSGAERHGRRRAGGPAQG